MNERIKIWGGFGRAVLLCALLIGCKPVETSQKVTKKINAPLQEEVTTTVLVEQIHQTQSVPISNYLTHVIPYEQLPDLTRQGLDRYHVVLPDTVPYPTYSYDFFGNFQKLGVCATMKAALENLETDIIGIAMYKPHRNEGRYLDGSHNGLVEGIYQTFIDPEKLLPLLESAGLREPKWEKVPEDEYSEFVVKTARSNEYYYSHSGHKSRPELPKKLTEEEHAMVADIKARKKTFSIWRYNIKGTNYMLTRGEGNKSSVLSRVLSDPRLSKPEMKKITGIFKSGKLVSGLSRYSTEYSNGGSISAYHNGFGLRSIMNTGATSVYEDDGVLYILQTNVGLPAAGRMGRVLIWRFDTSVKPSENRYQYSAKNGNTIFTHAGPMGREPECGVQIYFQPSTPKP